MDVFCPRTEKHLIQLYTAGRCLENLVSSLFSLFTVPQKPEEVIPPDSCQKLCSCSLFFPLSPPFSASSLILQCFIEFMLSAYSFTVFSLFKGCFSLFLTLRSRFLVITSGGSRTLRLSLLRSSTSPATPTTNTFSM